MALGSAWSVSLSGLSAASEQLALVSRNVARAGDADSVRKIGQQVTAFDGSVRLARVARTADSVLLEGTLAATAQASQQSALAQSLDRLHAAANMDPSLEMSAAARVANLEVQLRLLANNPSDRTLASQVVLAAEDVAGSLNEISNTILKVRSEADGAIAEAVDRVKASLAGLEKVNREIVTASPATDITDQLDRRDAILKELSSQIGIRTVSRAGNDIAVYTDGGVVLFETVARDVTFLPSNALGAGSHGFGVTIDAVDVTGDNAVMPLQSGRIAGLVQVRDDIAPVFQAQADELARALIEAFADWDRSGSGKPELPGLFTWPGGTVLPTGSQVAGLAAGIAVNPRMDPAQGGDLRYLRDGGASAPGDPDYSANPSQLAGFSTRILDLIDGLSAARQFDGSAGLEQSATIKQFAAHSIGWLQQLRKNADDRYEASAAVRDRANESLLRAAGINLDQEMSDLLRFEQSYQASSRLIATVDQLIRTVLETAGRA